MLVGSGVVMVFSSGVVDVLEGVVVDSEMAVMFGSGITDGVVEVLACSASLVPILCLVVAWGELGRVFDSGSTSTVW